MKEGTQHTTKENLHHTAETRVKKEESLSKNTSCFFASHIFSKKLKFYGQEFRQFPIIMLSK